MSTTVDIYQTHLAHQNLNSSPAKQMYSIPKAKRFNQTTKSYCAYPAYDVPDFKSKRGTTLGMGQKYDFTMSDKQKPGPNQYQTSSFVQYNQNKKKGFSFTSRDKLKFGDFTDKSSQPYKNPGVGQYKVESRSSAPKYSLGRRTYDPQTLTTVRINPGPSQYNHEQINKTGNYFYRGYKSSGATKINPPSSIRFKPLSLNKSNNIIYRENQNKLPGPDKYNLEQINQKGKYADSKYKSVQGGRWSTGERTTFYSNSKTPAPGYYKKISQFGNIEYPPVQRVKQANFFQSANQTKNSFKPNQTKSSQNKQIQQQQNNQHQQQQAQEQSNKNQTNTNYDNTVKQQQQQKVEEEA